MNKGGALAAMAVAVCWGVSGLISLHRMPPEKKTFLKVFELQLAPLLLFWLAMVWYHFGERNGIAYLAGVALFFGMPIAMLAEAAEQRIKEPCKAKSLLRGTSYVGMALLVLGGLLLLGIDLAAQQ